MNTPINKIKQRGFSILGVILVVVAIVGVLGVWAMSGQTNTSNSADSAADVMGSSIVNDGSAIKTAFDQLLINGQAANAIVFVPGTAGANNILDPTNGIQKPVPNSNAVSAAAWPEGMWIYHTGIYFPGIGVDLSPDISVVLLGVKDGVCQQINRRLYGSAYIYPLVMPETDIPTGATAAAPSSSQAVNLSSGVPYIQGWTSGCIHLTGGPAGSSNMYFRVLKAL